MNFKSHRKRKSILVASSLRDTQQRRSSDLLKQTDAPADLLERAKQIYYSQKNLPEAVQLFNAFLEYHPQHNEALYLCGVAYLHINNTQQSIECLLRVSQESNHHQNAILLAAMAYNKQGNFTKSLEIMDKCIQMYPFFEEGICFRGRLHLSLKNYHKAELDFKCAIGFKKGSYLSLLGLADCLKATNKSQKALQYYKKAKEALLQLKNSKYSDQLNDIELKIGVCLYSMQKYTQSLKQMSSLAEKSSMKISELYYYIGLCSLKLNYEEKGLLNLQYSIRLQTNISITKKAYKKIIICYLKNFQFYEALNIVKLGDKCGIQLPEWKDMVQSFMLIIKGNYEKGANTLKEILNKIKTNEAEKASKIKKESFKELKSLKEPFKLKIMDKPRKMNLIQSPKRKDSGVGVINNNKSMRKRSQFFNKSVQKAITKIGSVHNYKQAIRAPLQLLRYKTEHVASDILHSSKLSEDSTETIFTQKQKQVVYPFILKFKAYSQFFMNNFMACIQTYEEYQAYMKDMFGKQSDLSYNRLLCEAMLMSQTDMADDALSKYSECVQFYFQKHGKLAPEPILYKTILLIRLAASKKDTESSESEDEEIASLEEILESTLKMIQNYKDGIKDLPLAHFFEALVYILQQKLEKARECLQRTLKLTDQCNWKFLYVKGVIEMMLGNHYDAVKQLSAGLILQNRAQFYLCRSICFFALSQSDEIQYNEESLTSLIKSVNISAELSGKKKLNGKDERFVSESGDIFLEYCFQDLQSYIELETDKNQISIWVSKLLFVTKSFEEAISSLQKIPINNSEMFQLAKCIQIYEGQFEDGGNAGFIIKSAFDGIFLTPEEQAVILQKSPVKNFNQLSYDYLTNDYEKWLIILHIYVKSNHQLLLKFIQKELFSVKDQKTEVLLRYNLCVLYLFLGELTKTVTVAKSLLKFQKKYALQAILQKLINCQFEEDECLGQLGKGVGIGSNKLLSSYLPFQPVYVNLQSKSVRIYVRVNVPFPKFPNPNMEINIDKKFILEQITADMIQKKIEAPWIHKINNQIIQFTQKLDESSSALEDMSSKNRTPSEKTLHPITLAELG